MASEDINAPSQAWERFSLGNGPGSEKVVSGSGKWRESKRVRATPALQALSYCVSCQPETKGWSGLAVEEINGPMGCMTTDLSGEAQNDPSFKEMISENSTKFPSSVPRSVLLSVCPHRRPLASSFLLFLDDTPPLTL